MNNFEAGWLVFIGFLSVWIMFFGVQIVAIKDPTLTTFEKIFLKILGVGMMVSPLVYIYVLL